MTYIQKKRIKLILLGLSVIALYIYLLGVMTAHAKWIEITEAGDNQVDAFYYSDTSVKLDRSTKIVKADIMFHFSSQGAKDFVKERGLDSVKFADLSYIISAVEFNYETMASREISNSAYDSRNVLIIVDSPKNPQWTNIDKTTLVAAWLERLRKDYNF